jgi:hypothetical protein
MKFKVDEWVYYCAFPDISTLSDERVRSVVLNILKDDPIYDYEIYVDGIGKIKKVKEQQLFSMPQPT